MIVEHSRYEVISAKITQKIMAHRTPAFAAFWGISALISASFVGWLNQQIGAQFDYPLPQLFDDLGLAYLAFSLAVTLCLAWRTETARLAMPWTTISLIAGICFYPFLFCNQSFLSTNFLSADWSYPLSQIQPPAKLVNPEPHDSSMLYFPLKYFWTEAIREYMTFPFWDFSRNSGMPFAAATLSGAFYPLNIIFLVTGTEMGWGVIGLIHLLVAGCGMFLLIEKVSQSRFAALFAGISFMLMPYLAGWSRGLVWNSSGVWLPLICFFTLNAVTQRNIRAAALAVIALTFATLGGWIQWVIYFYLLLGCCALQYSLFEALRGRIKVATAITVTFGGIVTLAILLSIVYFGLFHEVTKYQPRTSIPWEQVATLTFPYGGAANLAYLIPGLFGDHVQNEGIMASGWSLLEFQRYLGALCFPFALLSFARRSTAEIVVFLIFPLIFFLSVTNLGAGYELLYYFAPGFDAIPTQQTRALFIVEFIVLVISGLGASNLRKLMIEKSTSLPLTIFGCAIAYLLLALVLSSNLLTIDLPEKLQQQGALNTIMLSVWFLLASFIIILISQNMKIQKYMVAVMQCLVIALCTSELVMMHHRLASFSRPLAQEIPPIIGEIKAAGNARIFRTGGLAATHAFIQNTAAMMYGLNDTMAHDSVYLETYAKFISLFNPATDFHNPHALLTPLTVDKNNVELIRMLNVDYIFHKEEVTGTTADPACFDSDLVDYIRKDGGRHILRLKNPLPRAFFVQQAKYLPEPEVMRQLREPNFKAKEIAYLDDYAPNHDEEAPRSTVMVGEHVEYSEQTTNSFTLHYSSQTIRPVFISNVMYPGWRAVTERGDTLPIHRANLAFMVVFTPPAVDGKITFQFRPTHFRIYFTISIIALLILTIILTRPQLISQRFGKLLSIS